MLAWAKGLHDAGIPAHTIQVDDGWMSHYGDFTFNSKFPDPKALSDQIHAMGYNFGLWVTLWINNDADNFSYAAAARLPAEVEDRPEPAVHGHLVERHRRHRRPRPTPTRRAWYVGQLHNLQQTYGVDGFKFDTRFFDESCAPYPGYTAAGLPEARRAD